jgi:hypothetical protein
MAVGGENMKKLATMGLVATMFLAACSDVENVEEADVENVEKAQSEKVILVNTKPYEEHFAKEVYREDFNEDEALEIASNFLLVMKSGNEARIQNWLGDDIGLTEEGIYDKQYPHFIDNPAKYESYAVNKVIPLENGFQVVFQVGEKDDFMFLTFEQNGGLYKLVDFSMYIHT